MIVQESVLGMKGIGKPLFPWKQGDLFPGAYLDPSTNLFLLLFFVVQFSITQFSLQTEIHFYFNTFPTETWEEEIDKIKQHGNKTNTATAIKTVM